MARFTRLTNPLNTPRPNVRIVSSTRRNPRADSRFHRICRMLLEQTRRNVTTNLDGDWTPIQWEYQNGKRPGMLALMGTESQWELEFRGPRTAVIKPRDDVRHIWRGHVHGMTIHARDIHHPMPVPFAPKTIGMLVVKLPPRDPRPTEGQVKRILKGA